jgi:hypothetical protein
LLPLHLDILSHPDLLVFVPNSIPHTRRFSTLHAANLNISRMVR